jgi:hypothetical protein
VEKLLNPSRVAEILSVRPGTIYSWVSRGIDIPGRGSKGGGYKAVIWKAFLKVM